MTHILRAIVVLAVLGVSASASADEFYDTYQRGMAHFHAGNYGRARADYLSAYDLRPEPLVLFNIAQTYRLQSNARKALEYYRRFLAEPNIAEELRREAQDHVTRLEAEARLAAKARRKHAEAGPREVAGTTPERRIPLGSAITAGVAGASLVSALIFTKLGLDAERALENNPMPIQKDADLVERYQDLINTSWAFTGAAAITAVVIYFAAPRYSTARKTVIVAPGRDGGWSAAWVGRF